MSKPRKLSEEQWDEILERWSRGESQESIALSFDVAQSSISYGIRKRGAGCEARGKTICPHCLIKIPAHAKYCLHCGRLVENET